MFHWSFTSLVHFGHPKFLILATPMDQQRFQPRTRTAIVVIN